MKILITTDWYEPVVNGVVTSVVNLAAQLRADGHEVKILTLSRTRHSYIGGDVMYVASLGVGYVYPEARMKIPVIRKIVKRLIDWQPDLIHSQCEFSTFFMAKRIAEVLQIPIVHTYHTVYEDYTHYFSPRESWGRSLVQKLTRVVSEKIDLMIAPSEKIKDVLESYEVECPVEIVPSGIDTEKFAACMDADCRKRTRKMYGISEDAVVLIYIGRLAKEKNIEELLQLAQDSEMADITLMIVGGGPYRDALAEEVKRLAIADRVVFTGMIAPEHIAEYYQVGDLFVSASTSETQGMTYMEALAGGIPLLCREDPCLDDVIKEGENGWTYRDAASYKHALRSWIQMRADEQKRMRYMAADSVSAFSTQTFGARMEEIYERVLSQKKADGEVVI